MCLNKELAKILSGKNAKDLNSDLSAYLTEKLIPEFCSLIDNYERTTIQSMQLSNSFTFVSLIEQTF